MTYDPNYGPVHTVERPLEPLQYICYIHYQISTEFHNPCNVHQCISNFNPWNAHQLEQDIDLLIPHFYGNNEDNFYYPDKVQMFECFTINVRGISHLAGGPAKKLNFFMELHVSI